MGSRPRRAARILIAQQKREVAWNAPFGDIWPMFFPLTLVQADAAGISTFWMDVAQIVVWTVGIGAAVFAAWKGLREIERARVLRGEELKWRRTKLAREMLLRMDDSIWVQSALKMIEVDGRPYKVDDESVPIAWREVTTALTAPDSRLRSDDTAKESFIYDSFDALFGHLEHLEHAIDRGLIDFKDVELFVRYRVKTLSHWWPIVEDYLARYDFELAAAFLRRFSVYTQEVDPVGSQQPASGPRARIARLLRWMGWPWTPRLAPPDPE